MTISCIQCGTPMEFDSVFVNTINEAYNLYVCFHCGTLCKTTDKQDTVFLTDDNRLITIENKDSDD